MSDANATEHNREGGGRTETQIHGGGNPPTGALTEPILAVNSGENSKVPGEFKNAEGELQGAQSAVRIENTEARGATSLSLLDGGLALRSFNFPSAPFLDSTNREALSANKENVGRANVPSASSMAPPTGNSSAPRVSASVRAAIPFSQMLASDLAQIVADDIHNFNTALWIAEDFSGSAILKHIAPTALDQILEQSLSIRSAFTKCRIQSVLVSLVQKDLSIDAEVRERWAALQAKPPTPLAGHRPAATPVQFSTPSAFAPQNLFSTPVFGGTTRDSRALTPPAFISGRANNEAMSQYTAPSFLRECGSPEEFPMEDTSLFANTTRATAGAANSIFSAGGGAMSITINQPSATPPKYMILECATDQTSFYNWIRKNRKESQLALPVDRRTLSQLVGEDVKDEVARIIKHLGPTNTFYFNAETCPYPRSWPEVSDHLLLKILFSMNGPRSASEAKARLKQRLWYMNDSTTTQDKVAPKLRKFCNDFKSMLKDFAYTHYLWAEGDQLDHHMIIEAFSECFNNVEQIKGITGEMVPRSRNYAKIREMIRERKTLPLEDIIHYIIDSFEKVDFAVRGNKGISYDIKPWKDDENKNKKKRGFNQIAGTKGDQNAKKQRPATEFPRCANCGRKSHLCGERSCYTFGHPKGRGASGVWAEGEESLFIPKEEMKEWKKTRDPVFYAYPENQRPAKRAQSS